MSDLTNAAVAVKRNPTVKELVEAQLPAIERQLGGAMNSDAFVRAVLSEITKSPDLMQSDPKTLLGGVMLAAQLRLEIGSGLGEFYLTPRKDHGRWICLPIIGYQGMVKLALQSDTVLNIQAAVIREGDDFTFGSDVARGIYHEWRPRDFDESREMVGVLATAQMRGGGVSWAYLTLDQIHARRPSYWEKTPWKSNPEEMAKKTAVRALAKYLPKSTALGRALEADEQKVQQVKGLDEVQITRLDEPDTITVNESDPLERTPEEIAEQGT